MIKLVRFIRKEEDGNMTLEFGAMLPLFLMIVVGFVMFMNGIVIQIGLGVAAREGAREYSHSHYDVHAKEKAEEMLEMYNIEGATLTLIRGGNERGMTAEIPYKMRIPFFGEKTYQLARTSVFYMEPLPE